MEYQRARGIMMNTFERFESRTLISATLEMQTALSVGSRASLEPTGTDLPVIKDQKGVPFVPGSSIKGIVRSEMEKVLRSLERETTQLWACDPFGDAKKPPNKQCITSEEKDNIIKNIENLPEKDREKELSRKIWEASCTVCRLFGSPWFASRLAFKDASLTNRQELAEVTSIRDGVGIDRDRGAAKDGLKYDFEVVSPGAEFSFVILAENVESWEIGLLLSVLRPWQEGYLPIGGKSSRGPGWGKLTEISIERIEKKDLLDYLLGAKTEPVPSNTFVQSFRDYLSQGGNQNA